MQPVTLLQINERLKLLPPEKLAVVYDFVSYFGERKLRLSLKEKPAESYQATLASEEDQAWANLATDPVLEFGTQPITDEVTDASVNHDCDLYGAQR